MASASLYISQAALQKSPFCFLSLVCTRALEGGWLYTVPTKESWEGGIKHPGQPFIKPSSVIYSRTIMKAIFVGGGERGRI